MSYKTPCRVWFDRDRKQLMDQISFTWHAQQIMHYSQEDMLVLQAEEVYTWMPTSKMPYRGNIISLFLYLNEEKSFVILASNRRSETGRMRKKGKLKLRGRRRTNNKRGGRVPSRIVLQKWINASRQHDVPISPREPHNWDVYTVTPAAPYMQPQHVRSPSSPAFPSLWRNN